jgi:anti-anti-sigma factor
MCACSAAIAMTLIPFPQQPSASPAYEQGLIVGVETCTAGSRRVVRVRGELDLATVDLLAGVLHVAAEGRSEVVLDLSGLRFCDVVGLTAIEHASRQLAARGCHLILHGTEPLRFLLRIPGLFDLPGLTDPAPSASWQSTDHRHG